MKIKSIRSATTVLVSVSMLCSSFLPAFAQMNVEVTGNGAGSTNDVTDSTTNNTTVFQTNTATVSNKLKITSSTGGNQIKGTTGGNAQVETGNANISASVTNTVNTNQAVVDTCNCDQSVDALVTGNGAESQNTINHTQNNTASVVQDGVAEVTNELKLNADTGTNEIKGLTGGTAKIETGNVTIAPVEVINTVNTNVAILGAADPDSSAPHMGLTVANNGADSTNTIGVNTNHIADFFQSGTSTLLNDLEIKGNSGANEVDSNTMAPDSDGVISISTGAVNMDAYVDSATGFNIASDDCGCIQDTTATIDGNGTEALSDVALNVVTSSLATQDNHDQFDTVGGMDCGTGTNEAEGNTNGGVNAETGNCTQSYDEINTGSSNFFGKLASLPQVSSTNMTGLLSALGVSVQAE